MGRGGWAWGLVCWVFLKAFSAWAADWTVCPSLDVSQEFNSNVFLRSEDVVEDAITRFKPAVQVAGRTERSRVTLDGALNGELYWKDSSLDTVEAEVSSGFAHEWTERLTTTLGARFAKDETLESELEATGLVTRRVERRRVGGSMGATVSLSERFLLDVGGDVSCSRYSDGTFPDANLYQLSVNPGWRLSQRDTAGVFASGSVTDYEDSLNNIIRNISGGLFWKRDLSEGSRFSLQGGYRVTWQEQDVLRGRILVNPDGSFGGVAVERSRRRSRDDGFVFSGTLQRQWTEHVSTSFSAGREQVSSVTSESTERTYLRAGAGWQLTERLSAGLDVGYDLNTRQLGSQVDAHTLRVSPALRWRISENLLLRAGGSYETATDDVGGDTNDRRRFRAWVGLTWQLPRRLENP